MLISITLRQLLSKDNYYYRIRRRVFLMRLTVREM